ncbi:MAG: hypothetical protein WC608_02860 [Parcubacteria group bacterium]
MRNKKDTKNEFMTVKEWGKLLKEFVIMKEEVRIMKKIIKEKLGVEVRVI